MATASVKGRGKKSEKLTGSGNGSSSGSAKAIPAESGVQIDFPLENEQIVTGHYAVRISSEGPGFVEISIDGSEWTPCRNSVGYFWYDWWPTTPGVHSIEVRFKPEKGRVKKSIRRRCSIIGSGTN